ncbi:MAG: hypothetical protein JO033_20440 [Acidobacteriaceae bacterium]|nr:hypothetical protein [Acidobacteriaceae bacterium]MBV9499726.1 hypothetical protein [Acidobacteriaceae bacterium]
MKPYFVVASALAACLVLTGRASATALVTNSYNGWLADINGNPIELNFNGVTTGHNYSSSGITLNPFSGPQLPFVFTGPDGSGSYLFGATFSQYSHYFVFLEGASDGVGSINMALPTGGENAVYLNVDSTNNTTLSIQLSDGETFSSPAGPFGIALSQSISWLNISTVNGSHPLIDDFFFGTSNLTQQSPTFEVATLFLIGTGLVVIAGARRMFAK